MGSRPAGPLGAVIRRFSGRRVLVVGDMAADEYVIGQPARLSREAPVIILQYTESFIRPGCATNAAYNLSRLGADAAVVGVIGDDEMGRRLRQELVGAGINVDCLLVDPERATSTKTRIVGQGSQQIGQQMARIDRVDPRPITGALCDRMIEAVRAAQDGVNAILFSDYANGVVTEELIEACLPEARRRQVCVIVDSESDLFRFRGITAATPNQPEAAATLRAELSDEDALDRGGTCLLEGMDADGILITRGREGVALYERGRDPYKLPVALDGKSAVVDPTGAGDTVAAVFTLALTAGASMRQGAFLGNVAGGEAVRRFGTAALTQAELRAALRATKLPAPDG